MSLTPQKSSFIGASSNRLIADFFPAVEGKGDGAIAILLHGGGQTRHSWQGTARRLAEHGVSAYTIDARGHGESDWVADKSYTFWHFAKDVIAVSNSIKERHGRVPISIGASLGGISSMLALHEAGNDLLEKLVLVDITPRMDETGVSKILGFMSEAVENGFETVEEAADAIARYLPNRARPKSLGGLQKNLRQSKDGRWRWHWDPAFISGPGEISTDHELLSETLLSSVPKLTLPTLLVRGAQSELVTEAHAQEFLSLVPHAEFVDVTDAGHMVAGDRNDVFTQAVTAFLSG